MAEKRVKLKSCDGKVFEVDEAVALESELVKGMIEVGIDINSPIPMLNVTSKTLAKVIEYCKYHVKNHKTSEDAATSADKIKAWDAKFLKAADYMHIENLLDITYQIAANMIQGKNLEEIRTTFNIENDFSLRDE